MSITGKSLRKENLKISEEIGKISETINKEGLQKCRQHIPSKSKTG